jgi:hypothetical protein
MREEPPLAANDNKFPEEFRQERKYALIGHSGFLQRAREWMQDERYNLNKRILEGSVDEQRGQEIALSLDALEQEIARANEALSNAENQMDSIEAFTHAHEAMNRLAGVQDETVNVLSES